MMRGGLFAGFVLAGAIVAGVLLGLFQARFTHFPAESEYYHCMASIPRDVPLLERRERCAEATGYKPAPVWIDGVRHE